MIEEPKVVTAADRMKQFRRRGRKAPAAGARKIKENPSQQAKNSLSLNERAVRNGEDEEKKAPVLLGSNP